jgi:hypothetical protein
MKATRHQSRALSDLFIVVRRPLRLALNAAFRDCGQRPAPVIAPAGSGNRASEARAIRAFFGHQRGQKLDYYILPVQQNPFWSSPHTG